MGKCVENRGVARTRVLNLMTQTGEIIKQDLHLKMVGEFSKLPDAPSYKRGQSKSCQQRGLIKAIEEIIGFVQFHNKIREGRFS